MVMEYCKSDLKKLFKVIFYILYKFHYLVSYTSNRIAY